MSPSRNTHVGTAVLVQASSGVVAGLVVLALAAAAVRDYATAADDNPLAGLALLVAGGLGVPGVLGVVLGGSALAFTRRRPGMARTLAGVSFIVPVGLVLACVLLLVR